MDITLQCSVFRTKLEPLVSLGVPLSSCTKLSETNVKFKNQPKPLKVERGKCPLSIPETRTRLIHCLARPLSILFREVPGLEPHMMTVFGVKTGVNASSKLSKRCSLNAFPIANTPIPLAPPFEYPLSSHPPPRSPLVPRPCGAFWQSRWFM